MSWQAVKLSDVCLTITDGAHKSPPSQELGFPMASVKDMTHWGINLENCRLISQQDFDDLCASGCQPIKGDVLIAKDGNSCLQTVCVHGATIDMVLLSSVAILRPNPEKCDSKFLQYHLTNPYTKAALKNYVSGAAIPRVVLRDFKNYQFSIPSIDVQQKISAVLSDYDDFIKNNRRRIQLLEKSACLLYKEWFVQLRYPGHEHVKITDGVPDGWEMAPLGDLLTLQRGFDLPTKNRKPGKVPIYASTGVNGYHSEAKVKGPGVITGRSGSLGTVMFVSKDHWPLNTTLWVKEFKKVTPIISTFILRSLKLENYNGGAAVPTLNRNDVHKIDVLCPPEFLIREFDLQVATIFEQIEKLHTYNKKLSQARDILLPRLMSGELTV